MVVNSLLPLAKSRFFLGWQFVFGRRWSQVQREEFFFGWQFEFLRSLSPMTDFACVFSYFDLIVSTSLTIVSKLGRSVIVVNAMTSLTSNEIVKSLLASSCWLKARATIEYKPTARWKPLLILLLSPKTAYGAFCFVRKSLIGQTSERETLLT